MNKSILKQKAELYFKIKNDQRSEIHKKKSFPNKTLEQLSQNEPVIPAQVIDVYFEETLIQEIDKESLIYLKKRLHTIRTTINNYNPSKRFFILQTIDFFNNPKYIEKVIPALLMLEKPENKAEAAEFVQSTFFSLNKNIETIVSIPQLFSEASLHIERGGLYTYVTEVAKAILELFTIETRKQLDSGISEVALAQKLLLTYQKEIKSKFNSKEAIVDKYFIKTTMLREKLLDFIALIQTHETLLLYAKKRHTYYSNFLKSILNKEKLLKYPTDISSILLAASLISNPQIVPSSTLIKGMLSAKHHRSKSIHQAYLKFIDQLAPITVYDIINNFKQSLNYFSSDKNLKQNKESQKTRTKGFSLLGQIKKRLG